MQKILLTLIVILGYSCSFNKRVQKDEVTLPDNTVINLSEELGDHINHEKEFPEDVKPQVAIITALEKDEIFIERARKFASTYQGNEFKIKRYEVQKLDTLMLISFKIYGNYSRWREIKELNRIDETKLSQGQLLRYLAPKDAFRPLQNGLPYVIRKRDTLGKISFKLYETDKRWVDLYKNNRDLIKDPNKIYAGFTLFYEPAEMRLPAGKQ